MSARPRLGLLGVGWIGRHRLMSIIEHGNAEVVAIADPSHERRSAALSIAPAAIGCESMAQLLELSLDGLVVATPSAFHAEHCIEALLHGLAVFCQKPLGRSAVEVQRVVDAARRSDRLLDVDLFYRHTEAAQRLRRLAVGGELGRIYAIDLVFHDGYGPEAAWIYDKSASGGGCVIDLGLHLIDLALWLLDFPAVLHVDSHLFAGGEPLAQDSSGIEDFAAVQLELAGGIVLRLTCSWRLSAGQDAVIGVTLHGTAGGLAMKNVDGSFHDFIAERYRRTQTERLVEPPDAWASRAMTSWIDALSRSSKFDPIAERFVEVAQVLDAIYTGPDVSAPRRVAMLR